LVSTASIALILRPPPADLAGLGELSGLRSRLATPVSAVASLDAVDVCGRLLLFADVSARVLVGEGEKSNLRLSASGSSGRLLRWVSSVRAALGVVDLAAVLTRFENREEVAPVVVEEMSDSAELELELDFRRLTLNESSDLVGVLRLLSGFFFSLEE
jgi:hypothetical protein